MGGGRRRSDGEPNQHGGTHLGVSITSTQENSGEHKDLLLPQIPS